MGTDGTNTDSSGKKGNNGEQGKIYQDENGNWCVIDKKGSHESGNSSLTSFNEADNPFQ